VACERVKPTYMAGHISTVIYMWGALETWKNAHNELTNETW